MDDGSMGKLRERNVAPTNLVEFCDCSVARRLELVEN
jgi:hypothetical protein